MERSEMNSILRCGCSSFFVPMVMLTACFVAAVGAEPGAVQPWQVRVDFNKTIRPMNPYYAGINVNHVGDMVDQGREFDRAVAALGARFMRFQIPLAPSMDFRKVKEWKDSDFESLDRAVEKAYSDWGVKELLFCIHRLSGPMDGSGKFVVDEFDRYAEGCAALVRRYASPGKIRVRYWEPFNELDHPDAVARYGKHGQDFGVVVDLYRRCAKRMKQVNPDIRVGGPALCDPSEGMVRRFMAEEKGTADFFSWHDYATGSAKTPDAEVLRTVLEGPNRFMPAIRRIEAIMKERKRTELPLFMDEYHINYSAWDPQDNRTANQFSAVFTASVLANLSTTAVTSVLIHDLISRNYGLLGPAADDGLSNNLGLIPDGPGKTAIYVRPVGWVYRWFNELAGGNWVVSKSVLPSDAMDSPRGRLLDVCAWRNGSRRIAMLVNKDIADHPIDMDFGEKVVSEGFGLPIRVMMIVNNVPCDMTTVGTRAGRWRWTLPAMSVVFVTYELR
jgi:hypothetical protein